MRNEMREKNKGQACFIDLQKEFDTHDLEVLLVASENRWLQRNISGKTSEVSQVPICL